MKPIIRQVIQEGNCVLNFLTMGSIFEILSESIPRKQYINHITRESL